MRTTAKMDKTVSRTLEGRIKELFISREGRAIYESAYSFLLEKGVLERLSDGVLIGFSGGADSVMLASFFYELRRRYSCDFAICLCHVNHMIRGEEAKRDAEFSKAFAEELNLDFELVCRDIPAISSECGLGIEESARIERYKAFAELSANKGLSLIAIAHNASDNAETVLFNILRGAGAKGASGISSVRDNIIRPLISVSSEDIRNTLLSHSIDCF